MKCNGLVLFHCCSATSSQWESPLGHSLLAFFLPPSLSLYIYQHINTYTSLLFLLYLIPPTPFSTQPFAQQLLP